METQISCGNYRNEEFCWTPALAKVSHEFDPVCPLTRSSTHLFVCLFATQDLRIDLSVFFLIFFCMKLGIHKVKKVTIQFFEKKSWRVRRTLKVQKQPRNGVLELLIKMQSNHVSTFLIEYQSTNALLTFCRNSMRGKNLVLELGPKNLLRCETELLYLIRPLFIGATNLCSQFRWMWSDLLQHAQRYFR